MLVVCVRFGKAYASHVCEGLNQVEYRYWRCEVRGEGTVSEKLRCVSVAVMVCDDLAFSIF
jgi:hypothetical protein